MHDWPWPPHWLELSEAAKTQVLPSQQPLQSPHGLPVEIMSGLRVGVPPSPQLMQGP
jgi:hypothetical protein